MTLARESIKRLASGLGSIFNVSQAASVLNVPSVEAAKSLARWTKQGLLTRIRYGLYALASSEAISNDQPLENMWVVIPEIFSPGYVGGWSAAEHWDFTEQIFRDICVLTEKPVIHKKHEILGISFILTHIQGQFNFGTEILWISNKKTYISDPHKTIIDMLHTPSIGGGIQHAIDCFKEYVKSRHYDAAQLVEYAQRMNNGAVFKRLGYLSEKILGSQDDLTSLCLTKITKGVAYIDPSLKTGQFVGRWRLYVPLHLQIEEEK